MSGLQNLSLTFNNILLSNEVAIIPDQFTDTHTNFTFGTFNIKAETCQKSDSVMEFIFVVDCSGSMSDPCSDGRSKMQHIIHTLKNMVMFLRELRSEIYISVFTFDTEFYEIRRNVGLDSETAISDLLLAIDKIYPKGSTNIEMALCEAAKVIQSLKNVYPTRIINHIFMTDGETVDGSDDIHYLKQLVVQDIYNSFIGFGIEHDSVLLNGVGSVTKSSYHFIDKLENAGLVYGEILHSIIYKVLTDVTIVIEDGIIYDYKTNTWTNILYTEDIVSEADKTFHILSAKPSACKCMVRGFSEGIEICFDNCVLQPVADLTKYIYRQRTLQLMYEVNEYCYKKRDFFNQIQPWDRMLHTSPFADEKKTLNDKLVAFMNEMKHYMINNQIMDDKFMKNLCDDIYICHRTFDTTYGNMFCTSRRTSQGSQRQYTVSHIHDLNMGSSIPFYRRNIMLGRRNAFVNEPQEMDHEVSDYTEAPYLTPQATQVMRYISSSMSPQTLFDTQDLEETL